jgi:hypothetical protein
MGRWGVLVKMREGGGSLMRVRRRGIIIDPCQESCPEIFGKGACISGRTLVVDEIPLERSIACFGCKGQDTEFADLEETCLKVPTGSPIPY